MNTLQLACKVAANPRVAKLVHAQQTFRTRMVNDYGHDFMEDNGHEGVNRWTPAQRKEYTILTARLHHLRMALRNHYSAQEVA